MTSSCSAATWRLDLLDHLGPGGLVLLGVLDAGRGPACAAPASARNSTEPPSMMSVPRPAMLVATVTAPLCPASATILASLGVLLGVQHRVRDAALLQQAGQLLGLLDRDGADQDRLALLVPLGDVLDDGVVLRLLGAVDEVGLVDARTIGLLVGIGTTPSL